MPKSEAWQKSVSNMLWWSISSSVGKLIGETIPYFVRMLKLYKTLAGNAQLARQKILSIFHHVANQHCFPALSLFEKCEHAELVEPRPWIKPGNLYHEQVLKKL